MLRLALGFSVLLAHSISASPIHEVNLTPAEGREIQNRLRRFLDPKDASIMSDRIPRYLADGSPLSAGDNTRAIKQSLCRGVAHRYFPSLNDSAWETAGSYDRLPQLAHTWIAENRLSWDPSEVPVEGKTRLPLWSGDYWPLRYGATSYRYSEGKWFSSYDDAVASYSQPSDWRRLLGSPLAEVAKQIHLWSPAEKWDVSVGDTEFTLTRHQKAVGGFYKDNSGEVAPWMGLCHGWSAASIAVPRPERPVDVVGASGTPVRWLPDEIRSMVTLAWANAEIPTNYVGGRCDEKIADTYPNGRLKQPACFDTNPSTFYLALGNLLGRQGSSFVMDVSFDYQVWNQPIQAYRLTYFDATDPSRTSDQWKKVAVNYDARFKAKDRFQNPLTRGMADGSGRYDDRGIAKVVGVAATVAYLAETKPSGAPTATADEIRRMTFTFDLELYEEGGKYSARGGEWHENAHPDFLWLPQAGISALTAFDRDNVPFDGKKVPSRKLTDAASSGSARGYPICTVLKKLIDGSSGTRSYRCAAR